METDNKYFPIRKEFKPMIYAYKEINQRYKGLLKIGYTSTGDVNKRVKQQYPTLRPDGLPYNIVLEEEALREDGTSFTDKDVHRMLKAMDIDNPNGEWFKCDVEIVQVAINNVRLRKRNIGNRFANFKMRPEQKQAVEITSNYFIKYKKEYPQSTPHFLWNCKMRFGKTFAAYQLAKEMNWKRILVLTFKPAVEDAWEEDLNNHIDFEGWQFISSNTKDKENTLSYKDADKDKPIVCFGSFQDYLGRNEVGGIKAKNEWVHTTNWDCVVLDEYHYGAWNEHSKGLFEMQEEDEITKAEQEYDESLMPITTNHYLYLSGTPFRALNSGDFIEEQIYNWTYSDEQKAKENWDNTKGDNPYRSLPKMILMTYQLPDALKRVCQQGEFDEFDLNTFFSATGEGDNARFVYEDEVQKWLDIIRGDYEEELVSNLKLKKDKPAMPYSHAPLLKILTHTLWLFHNVSSCYAMKNLLKQKQNRFYHDYKIIVVAGNECGVGKKALEYLRKEMGNPLDTKTITLSCGKLTTGVTVRPWSGILMLCNLNSPETYFQSAFRIQSPWVIDNPDNISPNKKEIIKETCYIFDFAPNRALRQIAHYSEELNIEEQGIENKIGEFIHFLPVLAYNGFQMKSINPAEILDIAITGTAATLLARGWQSALLVNVDNNVLKALLSNEKALDAINKIEAFRNLNLQQDIEIIINKSEHVKKMKKEANEKDLCKKDKEELKEEEKEYRSKRKEIQEKLIKFATRIPIFMYLTDYREETLQDVIRQLEPGLFTKVTGITIKDFDLLVSIGVFNAEKMNESILYFKRYESASLVYIGIDRHSNDKSVGLYNTSINKEDYNNIIVNQPIL
jgi:hypothetical protein